VTFWAKHPDEDVLAASGDLLIDVERAVVTGVYAVRIHRIDDPSMGSESLKLLLENLRSGAAPAAEANRVVLGDLATWDAAWQATEEARAAAYESVGALREALHVADRRK
jgi:hypothetical protein